MILIACYTWLAVEVVGVTVLIILAGIRENGKGGFMELRM